jgi:hypothetical protein
MGCLPSRHSKIIPQNRAKFLLGNNFSSIRESLHSLILSIHTLNLKCKKGIESCFINHKKDLAVILRQKQNYLKSELESLQKLINLVDKCLDGSIDDKKGKKEVMDMVIEVDQTLNEVIIESNAEKIVGNDEESVERLKVELEKIGADIGMTKLEIEQEFRIWESEKGDSNGNRRKYSRTHSGKTPV